MEFCECGSLKINGNCTNKKCSKHVKKNDKASRKQIILIEGLFDKLNRGFNEAEIENMSADDAQRLIEDLEDELEEMKNRKADSEDSEVEETDFTDIDLDEDEEVE